jgi:hypothetical protein
MTIQLYYTNRIANVLFKAVSPRRVYAHSGLDHRFFADIGLNQSDIIALNIR